MGAGCAPAFGVPESTPPSRPFSLTIRLKTSATERTPWAGFQSYLPDITRASPVNLSESVPATFAKAACNPAGCDCPRANVRCKLRMLRKLHERNWREQADSARYLFRVIWRLCAHCPRGRSLD